MDARFWGVRGSHPTPGANTVRYGGHTSCVQVCSNGGQSLIVDAGTGLRNLGRELASQKNPPTTYSLVLSHVHWDHIQGLPFFEPAYQEGTTINVYALRAAADELQHVIGGITRHEYFPVALDRAPADFVFHEVSAGEPFETQGFTVLPIALNHPFGAVGYRVEADYAKIAYINDTAPFDRMLHKQHFTGDLEPPDETDRAVLQAMRGDLVEALRGVDTVIYDTHFTPEEYQEFPHWGHSTPDHALEICLESGVGRLVLYHHAPGHDDNTMDAIAAKYREIGKQHGIEVVAAKEGMRLGIGIQTNPGLMPL